MYPRAILILDPNGQAADLRHLLITTDGYGAANQVIPLQHALVHKHEPVIHAAAPRQCAGASCQPNGRPRNNEDARCSILHFAGSV